MREGREKPGIKRERGLQGEEEQKTDNEVLRVTGTGRGEKIRCKINDRLCQTNSNNQQSGLETENTICTTVTFFNFLKNNMYVHRYC